MAIPASLVLGLIELGKLGLQTWFSALRMAGKTEEEINQMYEAEKAEFATHEDLPEVPE